MNPLRPIFSRLNNIACYASWLTSRASISRTFFFYTHIVDCNRSLGRLSREFPTRVYEPVVGKQANEQVLDVNKGGVGTRLIASGWGNRCEHGPSVRASQALLPVPQTGFPRGTRSIWSLRPSDACLPTTSSYTPHPCGY